ncbi:hypothetical protein SAMN06265337_3841 [Hymenobacter gelipurpurascens]|uniref:SpoIIAA-like n=1 Tax=Hymenobacter gelipurpurascens TaxID=89968 RepID=A0A212UG68_9BACT|nr:hypothetical protein [Hymenobacter gelipurpurascens]SNC77258.1 hypothetical protein SAMN06265337_3841 [Hymenobacter gelipurpurascens]
MQLHPILDTPAIAIGYDSDNQWLYTDWKGEHDQESSQQGRLLILECLRKHPCHKILNDNSSITRTTVQLSVWGAWWLEEMMRAGLEYVAWVYPRNFEARQATEATLLLIQKPVVVSFDDVATAYLWLQKQGQKV